MSNVVAGSFLKRSLAVATASMVLLSGLVLTASPASANQGTEQVPYTYSVKVPVTKTVWEYQAVKSTVNGRTVVKYEKVAKTKTEYRTETRTGYRTVPLKAADKPAAAEFKVEVARDAAFNNKVKEIKMTPASAGSNKLNLSSQLSGNVGDVAFVRVVAKNSAGKSTAGKAAKFTFGKVGERTEGYSYATTERYITRDGYWTSDVVGYGTKPDYVEPVYINTTERYTVSEPYTAYRTESYKVHLYDKKVFSHNETYVSGYTTETYRSGTGSRRYSYDCSYYSGRRLISKTCYATESYPIYSTRTVPVYSTRAVYEYIPIYETRYREVAYTAYRDVSKTRTVRTQVDGGYWQDVTDYSKPIYGPSYYVAPEYGTRAATGYATRQVDVNGWKAAN